MTTSSSAQERLAVYGTLAPGRPNHHHLAQLRGRWIPGSVRGTLFAEGWGAALGFPGIVLDPAAEAVSVQVFESTDLPAHWQRLDDFEGDGYVRVAVMVDTAEGVLDAYIYALADASVPEA